MNPNHTMIKLKQPKNNILTLPPIKTEPTNVDVAPPEEKFINCYVQSEDSTPMRVIKIIIKKEEIKSDLL